MTLDDWHELVRQGVIGKIELLNGTAWCGNYRLAFSAEQIEAAAKLGIDLSADAAPAPPQR